ncbi:MAG: tetratricopeptide repeat protein [Bacteroidota bacterium]
MKRTLYYLWVVLLPFFSAFGQNEARFQKATEAYNKGNYEAAIAQYDSIIKTGQHSAALYFNMGNCHYKLDRIGPSIYYFEKALLLSPNDQEIRNNLGFAQNMRLDAIEEMPKTAMSRLWESVVLALTFDQWAYMAVFMIFLFVLCFVIYYMLNLAIRKRWAFLLAFTALFVGIFSLTMAYMAEKDFQADSPAIIFDREISVNAEPNERSETVFALHEGTKVNVIASLDAWHKIQIADGQTGWIPAESIRLIKDF